jgi:hypothetical protein
MLFNLKNLIENKIYLLIVIYLIKKFKYKNITIKKKF